MRKLIPILTLFKQAFTNLKTNDPIRMAGATAFFAFFALPPSMIIVSQVLSLLFNDYEPAVSGRLFRELAELLGTRSANQLKDISQHLQPQKTDGWLMIVSLFILLLASTTMFEVIKNSLNQLWNIKVKAGAPPTRFVRNRASALAIIIASGLLVTASLTINRMLTLPASTLTGATYLLTTDIIRLLVSLLTLSCWFALLFKYLPDIQISWRAVWVGSFVTALLFTIGEEMLTLLLTDRQMQAVHGRSGGITLVLLLVFYCSLIFYFGAAFTRQYSLWADLEATPADNAVGYLITEVEKPDTHPAS
ncbi:YihY/virulence factor BrkB family protein [Fibrella forsythiae]|uniref:YihY/virulence factor BrkB family protein n=1 Tax=Fibrella forsythiae TaxID=2817061 RepID=A0ABS3JPC3_9BACT|nr:YihY/virulence factor BrkB family protein [Fibrella forsythiae]MBO0951256.1 YihY/virulence factor BrkB family protein [Fibrella forsythiae]